MMMRNVILLIVVLATASFAVQTDQPYKGQERRNIKALAEADVDGLLKGSGMGLAKAAELNRYPGPMHVLQIKDKLGLTPSQEKRAYAAMAIMREEAKRLGKKIVEAEAALDIQFASGKADPRKVRRLTKQIGALQGDLRLTHLEAHLAMKAILSKAQIETYVRLRGYGG